MSHREEALGKTQDTLETMSLSWPGNAGPGSSWKSWRKCLGKWQRVNPVCSSRTTLLHFAWHTNRSTGDVISFSPGALLYRDIKPIQESAPISFKITTIISVPIRSTVSPTPSLMKCFEKLVLRQISKQPIQPGPSPDSEQTDPQRMCSPLPSTLHTP
ncbi:hypothetical protein L3Q82_001195 [Scortum barcoo]|uniref:Uncharacterized protein n=1 Tax=Scortum barcoo TaxID=214431 RepID=A0ACB8W6R7_9TELE|nr:hypothetical protein L3Q82_001195 [Scortum barcoo]